jgi:hypothetical protein
VGIDFGEYANTFSVNTAAVWYTTVALLTLVDKGNKKGNVEQRSQVIAATSIGGFNGQHLGDMHMDRAKPAPHSW